MENKLSKYVGLTIVGVLLLNMVCCILILATELPKELDLFLFVLFSAIFSFVVSYLIISSIYLKPLTIKKVLLKNQRN